ncbi:shikimate kinase [Geomonas sp.]|uniref:shikimate kinase n=1 Tax=Geomonas sp. TaxID=2651584 RepID=UPI002B47B31A|nr:shikimate kinase [Geomonas sp.]HJV33541.1 shikimate kinase [Geomonas sp.]
MPPSIKREHRPHFPAPSTASTGKLPVPVPERSLTLIGMPGSGKSVIGRIIANLLGWTFLDTDRLIEQRHGGRLQGVIDQLGEGAFRQLEEETVLGLEVGEPTVVATGGSVVYSEAAMRHLASRSTIVFLDASLEVVRQRIQAQAPRGIVGLHEGGLEELFRERLPLYRRYADLVVQLHPGSAERAALTVLRALSVAAVRQ